MAYLTKVNIVVLQLFARSIQECEINQSKDQINQDFIHKLTEKNIEQVQEQVYGNEILITVEPYPEYP